MALASKKNKNSTSNKAKINLPSLGANEILCKVVGLTFAEAQRVLEPYGICCKEQPCASHVLPNSTSLVIGCILNGNTAVLHMGSFLLSPQKNSQ